VTVHGRTRMQFYTGTADWTIIAEVKNNVKIPVIGNGDINEPEDARAMIEQTGCDGVMIGRGAMGNPWLLKRTVELLKKGITSPKPDAFDKINMALRHLQMVSAYKGDNRAVREMRKHIAWYMKGLRDSAKVRELVNKAVDFEDLVRILTEYREVFHPSG
ncbi:MAG TPA: tRNA-dihydrouridine synthase, partial [Desulfobacteria bacterium]|nr:tRNA-dihydrouridine synthase [Desulfobacteria bacterium]